MWGTLVNHSRNCRRNMETYFLCLLDEHQWLSSIVMTWSRVPLRGWSSQEDQETFLGHSSKKEKLEYQQRKENIGRPRESFWLVILTIWQVCIHPVEVISTLDLTGAGSKALEDVVLDEVTDLKMGFAKKEGEALAISYKMNVGILNILWNVTCGRKLHAQQQEFQVKLVIIQIWMEIAKLGFTPL